MTPLPYTVNPSEPCIYVELYLPKRAALQGALYAALTEGFKRRAVIEHFAAATGEKRAGINRLLNRAWTALPADYADIDLDAFPRLFYGYSTYEVDGVYLGRRPGIAENAPDLDENYQVMEERTQVIRLIFKPPVGDAPPQVLAALRAALRDSLSAPRAAAAPTPEVAAALARLHEWMQYVGLFVFGYLLYAVTEGIAAGSVVQSGPRDALPIRQDEIWVSSFWDASINVVEWNRPGGEPSSGKSPEPF